MAASNWMFSAGGIGVIGFKRLLFFEGKTR